MHLSDQFHECLTVAESALHTGESIVQVSLAKPESGSLNTPRFKVYVGVFDATSGAFGQKRCFLVGPSAHTGKVAIDTTVGCNAIVDAW